MHVTMRSTVRIDDDLMTELKTRAHAESVSLTRMLNRTLRAGLTRREPNGQHTGRFKQKTVSMGRPTVDLDKALALAVQLEDEEIARKLALQKTDAGVAGNLAPDAHLAALALTHGATLASCDADFSRFRMLRWENPLHGTP